MSSNQCRAKNPATCWKHGNPTDRSLTSLFDPYKARTEIAYTTRVQNESFVSQDADAYLEARGELELAELNYDSSVYGLSDLNKKIRKSNSFQEKTDLKLRLAKAKLHRASLLEKDSVHAFGLRTCAELKAKAVKTYENINDALKDSDYLNSLGPGVPILVETEDGYFIRKTGGAPLNERRKISNRLLGYSKFIPAQYEGDKFLVFADSELAQNTSSYKSLSVLKEEDAQFPADFVPVNAGSKLSDAPHKPGRYAVVGDDYYYQFEGEVETGFGETVIKYADTMIDTGKFLPNNSKTWYSLPGSTV